MVSKTLLFISLLTFSPIAMCDTTANVPEKDGVLTQLPGNPDIIQVDDIQGEQLTIEANGGNFQVSIFSRLPKNKNLNQRKLK